MQEALRSRLMDLQRARETENIPLERATREAQILQQRGIAQRQPDINAREAALARGAAAPERLAADIEAGNLESAAKVRQAKMKKQADEMDLFVQAFKPVLEGVAKGDLKGSNEAWDEAFRLLEENKVPGLDKLKITPREELLPNLRIKYQQALDTAPVIRARILDERNHEQAVELEKIRREGMIKAAQARAAAEHQPNTPNAVVARAMEKYRKDPNTINPEEQGIIKNYIETQWAKQNEEADGRLWQEAAARVALDDQEKGVVSDRKRRAQRTRELHNQMLHSHLRQTHPTLYTKEIAFDQLPSRPRQR